jgi:hypothetical protein
MQAAEYPIKSCREPVWNTVGAAHTCELPTLHTGPCASFSVAHSVTQRDAWEKQNPTLATQSVDGGDIIIESPRRSS